ncbi:hypothetical protein LEMLEM_LOCUS25053, partial [Lemmus lemmus]
SVVALGQRRPPAGERLEDAVGAALLVDAGRAGPLLRRLHLGLHAEPEALPAPRAAPGVARPPGRPLYPGARRREGVCLSRGGRRRCRRLSPSLASPSPRAGGCRPALIDSPPRQCLEGERSLQVDGFQQLRSTADPAALCRPGTLHYWLKSFCG